MTDGNYVAVGFSDKNSTGERFPAIFKFTPNRGGGIVWEKVIKSIGSTLPLPELTVGGLQDCITLPDNSSLGGLLFTAGYYKSEVNPTIIPIVAEFDYMTGNEIYSKKLNFPSIVKHAALSKMIKGADNASVFASGRITTTSKSNFRPMICKIDPASGQLDPTWGTNAGFTVVDIPNFPTEDVRISSISQRRDDGFIISGTVFNGKFNFGCAENRIGDAYLCGISSAGLIEWQKVFTEAELITQGVYIDSSPNASPFCSGIKTTETGNEFAFSVKESSTDGQFAVICRFDFVDAPFCSVKGCNPFDLQTSDGYLDCDLALIKFEINQNNNDIDFLYSLNTGRSKALDFFTPLISDGDEYFILASDVELISGGLSNKVVGSLIKVKDNHKSSKFESKWRKDFQGNANLFCPFGLAKTIDDGFMVCGNNENNGDDYELIKLGNDCQNNFSDFSGNNTTISSNTTWDSDKKIEGITKITNGATLTIQNCTIEFANTYLTNDYYKLATNNPFSIIPTNVIVEIGGTLILDNCILKGLNACSKDEMWEGVIVLGNPNLSQSYSNQGRVVMMNNAQIRDAYFGISAGERTYNVNGKSNSNLLKGGGIIQCENPLGSQNISKHFLNNRSSTNTTTTDNCVWNIKRSTRSSGNIRSNRSKF